MGSSGYNSFYAILQQISPEFKFYRLRVVFGVWIDTSPKSPRFSKVSPIFHTGHGTRGGPAALLSIEICSIAEKLPQLYDARV